MPDGAARLPSRRPELVIVPAGEAGCYVVKDPGALAYFQIGEEEHFLLTQLDGSRGAEAICAAFARRFGQTLAPEDLHEFLKTAESQGFLEGQRGDGVAKAVGPSAGGAVTPLPRHPVTPSPVRPVVPSAPGSAGQSARRRLTWQSILSWRVSLFDPDRLFSRLGPRIRFFWTPAFLVLSAGSILLATATVWLGRREAVGSFTEALRWETAVLAWLVLFGVTTLHEFAHGLTCKHHGGEVHEVGFFMLLLMPCFYCNVSDAWMFREKSKRLWVMFAGAYFELFVWSLGVFAWRLTEPGTTPNYLAFVVLSTSGLATLFNFNPLIKLDGYYLLSDWLEVPNLHDRAHSYFKDQLRRLLWGAAPPDAERRGRLLVGFGLVSWLYSVAFFALMLWVLVAFLGRDWGWPGALAVGLLGYFGLRGLFQGFSAGEVRKMITKRHKRTAAWVLILGGLAAAAALVQMDDRAGAPFRLRAAVRAELRAPIAGVLQGIRYDEGDRVSAGAAVARIEVPELESRPPDKQAEVRPARAGLRGLELTSPVGGVIVTPRLKEKAGQYVHPGDLIGVVEEPAVLEAEIPLGEQEVARVEPGQVVHLKARVLPLEMFTTSVERLAPAAGIEEGQTSVIVYCRLTDPPADLRPGMTGYARIYTGRRSIGAVLIDRMRRYVRTEFWW